MLACAVWRARSSACFKSGSAVTVALPVPLGAEVYVDRLDAPNTLTQGQQADAQALIVSNTTTHATARWYLDRTLISTAPLDLTPGETTIKQTVKPSQPGFHAVRVVIDPVDRERVLD